MPEFIISAGNQRWTGWKTISLTRSMETGPSELELTLTSNNARDAQRALNEGTPITAHLDNELLFTGYIDDLSPEYDADNIDLTLRARSKLADLVDCSTTGKQFNNQPYASVIRSLAKPFGIDVIVAAGVNANQTLRQPAIDEGQPVWDFLEREARALALRPMDTPKGELLITNAGKTTADALVLGQNVRFASATFSQAQRYSEYTVVANQSRSIETLNAEVMNINKGTSRDEAVNRYRPIVIVADDDLNIKACQNRAQWQRNTHFGRGQEVVYTVGGWQQSNGLTWQPNTRSVVDDYVLGVNSTRLIIEARLILDENGPRTELLVQPPEAMELTVLPRQLQQQGERV